MKFGILRILATTSIGAITQHSNMEAEDSTADSPFSGAVSENSVSASELISDVETEQREPSPSLSGSDVTTKSITSAISGEKRKIRENPTRAKRQKQEDPSFYDLVAGTVRKIVENKSLYRGQLYTRPYSAAEYYFERKRPMTGDEDEDARLYWHREVDHYALPPSDVLWAVLRYTSHFFGKKGRNFLKFMDETALLAIGVLLEETMKESLGETGYLAFLEPKEESNEEEKDADEDPFAGDELLDRIFRDTLEEQRRRLGDAALRKRKMTDEDDDEEEGFTRDDFLTDQEAGQE